MGRDKPVNGWSRLLIACAAACASATHAVGDPLRDVTFVSTSDPHYRTPDDPRGHHNDLNRASILEMNRIADEHWPEKLGGGRIAAPRGVLLLGDVIDDGDRAQGGRQFSREQYGLFLADFGFDGTDGLLKFPVLEGWGNHDGPPPGREKNGFSFQARLIERNALRKARGLISNVSENGLHYSWDWDDVHFVQLNLYPADRQRDGVRYSPVWHDPQGALTFLRKDLAERVGASGRPVVLMSHCGFDTDWWTKEDWKEAYDAASGYHIILYLYGHSGTGVRTWAPDGGAKLWDCINDGQTEKGFFVIQISGGRLRAAMRHMAGRVVTKNPDGTERREWGGTWEWKWLFDKPVGPPGPR